jgi:hypothetical protein
MLVGASTYNLCLFKQTGLEGWSELHSKKWLGDILGKLGRLFLDQAIWVEVEIPESYVSQTFIIVCQHC